MFTFPFTNFVQGFINKFSASFNGVDEKVVVAYNANMATASISISFWCKFTGNNFNILGAGSDIRAEVHSNSTTRFFLRGALPGGGNKEFHISSGVLDDNQWHHVVLTYTDGTDTMELYVDGAVATYNMVNNQAFPDGRRHTNGVDFDIGDSALANPYIGLLDEVSYWSVALSLAEVQEIYNSGAPKSLVSHSQQANLTSWWRLGDKGDDATTVYDQINSNNGTLTNMDATNYSTDVPT
jgi:hypothetical protein